MMEPACCESKPFNQSLHLNFWGPEYYSQLECEKHFQIGPCDKGKMGIIAYLHVYVINPTTNNFDESDSQNSSNYW